MIIECPKCNKKFNLDGKLIPKNGRTLKCSGCGHIWHHKISQNIENNNNKLPEDKNNRFDIKLTKINQKDNEVKEKYEAKDNLNDNKDNISEKKFENLKVETKDKKVNDEKSSKLKMIFINLIILIISLLGLILLLDTYKYHLSNVFPNIIPLLDSLNETMLDLKLFFKDLIN